jgi:hypothetical protein
LEAFCATKDSTSNNNNLYNFHEERFVQAMDEISAKHGLTEKQCEMLLELSDRVRDSIMFVIGEGRLGLAYHPDFINGIRAGDVVVDLSGINLPFILRPDA